MIRLDSVAQALSEKLSKATIAQQRSAARTACVLAVSHVGLEGADIGLALQHLRSGGPVDSELLRRLEAFATELDDEYLRLEEEDGGRTPESLRAFHRSRAVSALVICLADDPGQLHEVIYEAIAAFDDAAAMISRVSASLLG